MDILTIVLACSLFPDDQLVNVMAEVASRGNPFFVGNISTLETYDTATSKPDALGILTKVRKSGGKPGLGLLGIPADWAGRFARRPEDLFDACTNISIATAVLAEHHDACRAQRKITARHLTTSPATKDDLRLCTLRRFGADVGLGGYAGAILGALAKAAPPDHDRAGPDPAPERSPVFVDGTAEAKGAAGDWSSPSLFIAKQPPVSWLVAVKDANLAGLAK